MGNCTTVYDRSTVDYSYLFLSYLIFSFLFKDMFIGERYMSIDTQKLLENLNIKEVIETYTGRSIRGSNKTICPFHNDHNASLTLKTDKGMWRCWVCDKGGNSINFVREYYGLSFIEACKKLSEDFNVDDIGLWEKECGPEDVWRQVEIDCQRQRRRDLQQLREEIDIEIETLTAVHRCLFHLGYYDAAERYGAEIDDLIEYKQKI